MKPSEHPRPSAHESIEATAAAWLAQRDAGFAADEARSFSAWRVADPRHEAAVARLEDAWAALQALQSFRPGAARHPDRDLLARPAADRAIAFPGRRAALAAAAALLLVVAWWSLRPAGDPTAISVHATTAGGYERVMLADGSILELNSDSSAEVRFSPLERWVRLDRGEAHFTVAANPARPFRVEAGGVAVRAVGTAFNVRVGRSEVEVLVTEGKVAVTEVERVAPRVAAAPNRMRRQPSVVRPGTLLVANERTLIATARAATAAPPAAPVVERIAPEAVREALAWQTPRLRFVDTPLAEVIAQFNRRNRVQLDLADPTLATLPVGGSFRADNVEAFVRLLESGGDVAADRTNPLHVSLRRAR